MKPKMLLAALVISAATVAVPPAYADRGGRDDRSSASFEVSREQAEATARAEGLSTIREVKARRGAWKFEGWTATGLKIEVSIDGRTGEVIKREIYGAAGSSDSRSNSN